MEWITIVISIISVLTAGLALWVARQSNQLSEKTHNENKQINLKLRLSEEIYEVRTLISKLFILSINVSSNDTLSRGLRDNTVRLLDTLAFMYKSRNKQLPEQVISYRKYLTETWVISADAMEQVHNKIMSGYHAYEVEIQEISKTINPSTENIARVIEIKTLIHRSVDNFNEIENQAKKHISDLNKVQESITKYISTISN